MLNILTAAGMSGTQWRQEKEVRQEKLARLEEMKDSALVTSSWVKERLEVLVGDVWCVDWQCVIISSDISTPTTSPPVPRPPSPPWARAKVVSPVPQPKSNNLKHENISFTGRGRGLKGL